MYIVHCAHTHACAHKSYVVIVVLVVILLYYDYNIMILLCFDKNCFARIVAENFGCAIVKIIVISNNNSNCKPYC